MNCALIVGCSSDENLGDGTLSGNGKTPLLIEASLCTGNAVTRAEGKTFATGDWLLAYIRHTTGGSKGSYLTVTADQAPRLVTFTKGSETMSYHAENVNKAGDFTASYTANNNSAVSTLYWDDFSTSTADGSKDLRTSGHGLQSYYGYCYNGGTPSTALVETTGVLGWTVQENQSTANSFQHSDLLWSSEQETVTYLHSTGPNGARDPLYLPFTHAMSEVTVTVTCTDGFVGSTNPLASTVLTLNAMGTVTTLNAPTGKFTAIPGDNNINIKSITMCGDAYTTGLTRNYSAIVAPGTKLKVGEKLLDIVNVDDNNYTLNISGTDAMLKSDAWANGHDVKTDDGTYILTKPGYNYHLEITVSKTAIDVEARITDWTTVNSTGTGVIQYPNDVVSIDVNDANYADNSSFSLFMVKHDDAHDTPAERNNDSYTFATISTYATSTSKWTNSPTIYWPNGSDNYYFRALAKFNGTTEGVHSIEKVGTFASDKGTTLTQGTIADGHDILWGTTPAHECTDIPKPSNPTFDKGQAIRPRTGNVPIAFEHAMSKVTFQLETTSDEVVTMNNAKVNLTGATIAISNLATSGTISIETGNITPASTTTDAITATPAPISELIVIPQTIANDAKVTITLADGTTYKLQLNQCVLTGSETAVGAWEQGKHYTYTIHLEKEQITFRALVKDWVGVTGSGNANLEWD